MPTDEPPAGQSEGSCSSEDDRSVDILDYLHRGNLLRHAGARRFIYQNGWLNWNGLCDYSPAAHRLSG